MGENRHFFKKIRETKGIFHAKMGTIKDRNCMDLTEAEDIKKIFLVQFFCVFLPSLLNIFFFC